MNRLLAHLALLPCVVALILANPVTLLGQDEKKAEEEPAPFDLPGDWRVKTLEKKSGGFIAVFTIEADGKVRAAAAVIVGKAAFKTSKARDNFKGGTATVAMFDAIGRSVDLVGGETIEWPFSSDKVEFIPSIKQVSAQGGTRRGDKFLRFYGEGSDDPRSPRAVGLVQLADDPEDVSEDRWKLLDLSLPKLRRWKDVSGKFSVQAEFIAVDGDTVKLRKQNRDVISLKLNVLSDSDQQYIREQAK